MNLPPSASASPAGLRIAGEADKARNFGLDVVRAVAILLVLFSHGRHYFDSVLPPVRRFFVLGYLGVEVFFVLSGFLIGGILVNIMAGHPGWGTLVNFWMRRWFRTLPNYYLFLAIETALAVAALGPQILPGMVKYLAFLQTFHWPLRPMVFNVSWSLAVEEWFYLLVPVFLLCALRFLKNPARAFPVVIGFVLIASLALRCFYATALDANWGPQIRNTTILRLDAIMFGVCGAWLFKTRPALWESARTFGWPLGAALLLGNAIFVQSVDVHANLFAKTLQFSLVPFAVLCCLPWCANLRCANRAFVAAITRISLWSYSAYLCHLLVMRGMEAVLGGGVVGKGPLVAAGKFALFLTLTFVVSALVYRFFERPMTELRTRFTRSEKHLC